MGHRVKTDWVTIFVVGVVSALVAAGLGVAITWQLMAVSSQMLAGAGGPAGAPAGDGPQIPPAKVRVAEVKNKPLQDRFSVVGRLQALQQATVAAEVAGKILEVPVEVGDRVEGGQTVLARIDDVWATLAHATTKAEVAARRAALDQSQRDLGYLESLQASGSAKPKEVEDARAKRDSDQAMLEAAIAAERRAIREVERLNVLAPFDGTVTAKLTEAGQWVDRGSAVIELISRGQIDAVIDVPERIINMVNLGDIVEVRIDALGQTMQGEVVAINPAGRSAARTFPVKIRMDDRDGALKAGMSVTAMVPITSQSERLTVPRDAVMYGAAGAMVWLAESGEGPMPVATSLNVSVLFGNGPLLAIEAASPVGAAILTEGSQVVVEGAERLTPGQPLLIKTLPLTAETEAETEDVELAG